MQKPMTDTAGSSEVAYSGASAGSTRSLWIAVCVAFALLIAAWCILFVIASRNHVQEVPLPNPPSTTR